MNALATITMSTEQGLVFGLLLIFVGFISSQALTRWAEADDEPIVDEDAVHDEAIALTIDVEKTLPLGEVHMLGGVPAQRQPSEHDMEKAADVARSYRSLVDPDSGRINNWDPR